MKKNSKTLRTITAAAIIVLVAIGFVTNLGIGTISAPGFWDISILCPLGALGTMLASKMMMPRAVVSLVIMIVLIVVFARAFCAWMCPVPLVQKLRGIFAKNPAKGGSHGAAAGDKGAVKGANVEGAEGARDAEGAAAQGGAAQSAVKAAAPLSEAEQAALKASCSATAGESCGSASACASCAAKRGEALDARHFVLGGALLSTFAFGFPVFCLVCPIGLTFALILLVINLFAHGDVTWSLILVPALLAAEVLFFKKWCHKLCPLSAFMSLVAKANKTFVPTIDDAKCLETGKGSTCGACSRACEEGIDPRHPQLSEAAWSECTKCRACVDACPTGAITMPLLPKKRGGGNQPVTLPVGAAGAEPAKAAASAADAAGATGAAGAADAAGAVKATEAASES